MATFDDAIRELTGTHPKAIAKLRELVSRDNVRCIGSSPDGKTLAAVTETSLLVGHDKIDGYGWAIADLRSVSVLPDGVVSLVTPLGEGEFYSFGLEPDDARRIAAAVRALLPPAEPDAPWWDDPQADIGSFLRALGLIVCPAASPHHEHTICNVSFANTGVQIHAYKDSRYPQCYQGDATEFIPWSAVHSVTVEGSDPVERRPSAGAVVAFGILGLGASKTIRRAYLVVATDAGDYYFEQDNILPAGLAARIGPVLRLFTQPDGSGDVRDLLVETNRLLGEILDAVRSRPTELDESGDC
jgi:hypothetical protein